MQGRLQIGSFFFMLADVPTRRVAGVWEERVDAGDDFGVAREEFNAVVFFWDCCVGEDIDHAVGGGCVEFVEEEKLVG